MSKIRTAYFGSGDTGKQAQKIRVAIFGTGEPALIMIGGLEVSPRFEVVSTYSKKPVLWSGIKKSLIKDRIDAAIVCNYGAIIPASILDVPRYGFWNIHFSLLPKYRGATPVQTAILNGDKTSGVTVIKMNEKLDEGDILSQIELPILPDETAPHVIHHFSGIAWGLVDWWLPKFVKGKATLYKQKGKASYCYKSLTNRENARIKWTDFSEKIDRTVRAFQPDPCAWTELSGKEIKLLAVKKVELNAALAVMAEPGTCFVHDKRLYAKTGDGVLGLLKLAVAGKREMAGAEFANGYVRENMRFS